MLARDSFLIFMIAVTSCACVKSPTPETKAPNPAPVKKRNVSLQVRPMLAGDSTTWRWKGQVLNKNGDGFVEAEGTLVELIRNVDVEGKMALVKEVKEKADANGDRPAFVVNQSQIFYFSNADGSQRAVRRIRMVEGKMLSDEIKNWKPFPRVIRQDMEFKHAPEFGKQKINESIYLGKVSDQRVQTKTLSSLEYRSVTTNGTVQILTQGSYAPSLHGLTNFTRTIVLDNKKFVVKYNLVSSSMLTEQIPSMR